MSALRVFLIRTDQPMLELEKPPNVPPEDGFIWLAVEREQIRQQMEGLQDTLHQLTGLRLLDLHVSDLLNKHLPSRFDYTSSYDQLVFRRLAAVAPVEAATGQTDASALKTKIQSDAPLVTGKAQTDPVGLVAFDRVLLSIHPDHCTLVDIFVQRLRLLAPVNVTRVAALTSPGQPASNSRLPFSPADLMLRLASVMVDGYLDLRKTMSQQLDHWQYRLLQANTRFDDWDSLLKARLALHHLDELCDDQHVALSDWMDLLEQWPEASTEQERREHELLMVRTRDVLEHIERVTHHIRQLERSAETAVQIHFNIQSNRANDVMRTLTAITAVFLPLNLIAGVFGMNFDTIPWLHAPGGFWGTMTVMLMIAVGLLVYFSRKRYFSDKKQEGRR
ncbi:magnesium transporter CorA family protein [Allopusillimonas ginsengisoli]|uniref:magnesium transporter CorA family protein n=1 Tax=Allopusillimonas ginsengisoli TaxID=453575 RepID=UPI0039C08F66